jgi:hypothetical protein
MNGKFIIEIIIVFGISSWMILTGNYGPRLGLLRRVFRTKRPVFAPSGNWVRITGGIFFIGMLFALLGKIGVFNVSPGIVIVVFSTVFILSCISIAVSIIVSLRK